MSFKGMIETCCPKGCEAFTADVWSFIHGGNSPELRLTVQAQECNLLLCPGCEMPFFAEAAYIYYEPGADILAFVFPEAYRAQEAKWRDKMCQDFLAFKDAFGRKVPLDLEPEVFFGPEGLSELLSDEDYRTDERGVMEFLAKELGLSIYHVRPGHARKNKIPASLPSAAPAGKGATRGSIIAGLEKLLAANDRLTAYGDYLARLKASSDGVPLAGTAAPR